MKLSVAEIDNDGFIQYLENEGIFVKAFVNIDKSLKIYGFSPFNTPEGVLYLLVELILDFGTEELSYTVKSNNRNAVPRYEEYLGKIIEPLL